MVGSYNIAEARYPEGLINAASVASRRSGDPRSLLALLAIFIQAGRAASDDAKYLEEYVANNPDIAVRETRQGHLTGSVLLLDKDKRCLLTLHRKYKTWQQLGGHADGNFDMLAVASREGFEESGINQFMIDPIPIDIDVHDAGCFADTEIIGRHFDICFAGFVHDAESIVRTEESIDLKWLHRRELPGLGVSQRLLRLVDSATDVVFGR